jgi:hypothetical protein
VNLFPPLFKKYKLNGIIKNKTDSQKGVKKKSEKKTKTYDKHVDLTLCEHMATMNF